jgi:hypothetical protein
MNTFMLTDPQLRTLIDIIKDDCESTGWGDIDYTDAEYMEFLALRAGILKILNES